MDQYIFLLPKKQLKFALIVVKMLKVSYNYFFLKFRLEDIANIVKIKKMA